MADKKKLNGVIASAKLQRTNDKGWSSWDIVLTNGVVLKSMAVGPDGPDDFNVGDHLHVIEGRYTKTEDNWSWLFDKVEGVEDSGSAAPSDSPKQESKGGNGYSGKGRSSFQESKDEFNRYQITQRDPKIERQTYIRLAVDTYVAALPYLKDKPVNTQEVDKFIDDAVAKGEALYDRLSKK